MKIQLITQLIIDANNLPSSEKAVKTKPKQDKSFHSFFIFDCVSVVSVLFCGLIKGISSKNCILCVCVEINKRSFEPFYVGVMF